MAKEIESTLRFKIVQISTMVLLVLFWATLFLFFINYSMKSSQQSKKYQAGYEIAEKQCEEARKQLTDYSPENTYDLYHDNGAKEPPVCRHPETKEEVDEIIRQRAYRQQLENGDIDPPSLDQECYSPTICN